MDIAQKINKYLEQFTTERDPENDSLNIVEGNIYSWSFTNIPQPTQEQLDLAEAEILAEEAALAAIKPDVSPRQLRLALLSAGITEAMIDGAIALLESPSKEQAQIAWKYSLSYKRSESAVTVIGTLAGLTNEQLDAMWDLARTL